MDDLLKRIKSSIENRSGDPWFPELTADLAARAWDRLQRDIGLTQDSYSTERVVSNDISAPHTVVTALKIRPFTSMEPTVISIEALSEECAVKYQRIGVSFYSSDEIVRTTVLSCVEDAFAIISQVPSLMRTVAALVRSLHVIRPKDEDHDVSFSEPQVPFSIFVSVPAKRIANDAFRVAEAIVHEAMHLQLTLIENATPLTALSSHKYFSPWRNEHRTAQGVMHALYVFTVIDLFLARLLTNCLASSSSEYLETRRRDIESQMSAVESFKDCSVLTKSGKRLVMDLFQSRLNVSRLISSRNPVPLN